MLQPRLIISLYNKHGWLMKTYSCLFFIIFHALECRLRLIFILFSFFLLETSLLKNKAFLLKLFYWASSLLCQAAILTWGWLQERRGDSWSLHRGGAAGPWWDQLAGFWGIVPASCLQSWVTFSTSRGDQLGGTPPALFMFPRNRLHLTAVTSASKLPQMKMSPPYHRCKLFL